MQTDLLVPAFYILVLIISVILHEIAHGYAANALGDPTAKLAGRLTLNPLPHIDLFGSIIIPALLVLSHTGVMFGWAKPVPYNPYNLKNQRWGEAIVGISGVATNLLIAVLFGLLARVSFIYELDRLAVFLGIVCVVNLSLALFNLIPFPPLDGFTTLRGLLPYRMAVEFRKIEQALGGLTGLVLFLLAFNYILAEPFFGIVRWLAALLFGF